MRAAVLYDQGDSQAAILDEIEPMPPGPEEVVVRVEAVGLCQSDLAAMEGKFYIPTPAVLGHEAAGVVTNVGHGVTKFSPGDHVVIGVSFPCGKCDNCTTRSSPHLCAELFFEVAALPHFRNGSGEALAAMGAVGAFSQFCTVRQECLVRVPQDIPFDHAALLSCGVTCGAGAVWNQCDLRRGESVVIFGMGGVGLAAVQAARIAGAQVVLGVDPQEDKFEVARTVGATHVCTPDGLARTLEGLALGGFDYAIEASGHGSALDHAWSSVRRGGTVCVVGLGGPDDGIFVRSSDIYFSEKKLVGSYHGSADFAVIVPRLVEAYQQGHLDLESLISSRLPLHDLNLAISRMKSGRELRIIIRPHGLSASQGLAQPL